MKKSQKEQLINYLYTFKSFGYKYNESVDLNNLNSSIQDEKSLDMIEHCMLCQGSKMTQNRVLENGNKESPLVIISNLIIKETQEIELLKKMINNVLFLNFESIYMLNIVKCDLNKKDLKNEYIAECKPYIYKQLEMCNKNAHFIFIGESYKHILNSKNVIQSGTIIDFFNQKALILPELDHILKNPSIKNVVFDGLKRIKVFMEQ
ncbi:MAG TPA: hypothetical protein ENK66_05155 [Arcobacter sp.]|jgi:uracil-DNA glycosylase|nr:hypothetical protein [Arcobacter sp.]